MEQLNKKSIIENIKKNINEQIESVALSIISKQFPHSTPKKISNSKYEVSDRGIKYVIEIVRDNGWDVTAKNPLRGDEEIGKITNSSTLSGAMIKILGKIGEYEGKTGTKVHQRPTNGHQAVLAAAA